jgi:hypothetical protein
MKSCGACGEPMRGCNECGGLLCSPGCADRAEDGCTCHLTPDDLDAMERMENDQDEG